MKERVYALAICAPWASVIGPRGLKRRYLLLNRAYKPFGTGITEWVPGYDDCPGTRVWLDEKFLRAIDGGSRPYRAGDSHCWLYHDGTKGHHVAYRRRFAMLLDEMCESHALPVAQLSTAVTSEAR